VAGRYEVLRTLGQGATARVELVRDVRDERRLALKWAPLDDAEACHLLRTEFRLRGFLSHPQVPDVHDLSSDEEAGIAWLTMEYTAGRDLAGALRAGGPDGLAPLLAQALHVLGFLHRRGVVHGDLKPEHLVVAAQALDGRPLLRVLDLGFSVDSLVAREDLPARGTRAYMAPSLLAGDRPSVSTDLFALGRAFLDALADVAWQPSPALRRLLRRLAQPDEHVRHASAHEALQELEVAAPGVRTGLPPPRVAPFLGQGTAIGRLSSSLTAVAAGGLREPVLLLRGLPGSGRSRFVLEAHREALLRGLRSVSVRAVRGGTPLEPLLALARALEPAGTPRGAALEALARRVEGAVAGRGALSPGLVRELATWFRRAGEERPTLLLLDDLENACEHTVELLRLVARLAPSRGPLFLVTSVPRRAHVELLAHEPRVVACTLEPLSPEESRALVRSLLPVEVRGRAAELAQASGGNAALATLLAHEAAARAAVPAAAAGVPLLDSLLEARISRVVKPARDVLLDLAVLLRPAPEALLHGMRRSASGTLRGLLGSLERAGLARCQREADEPRWRIASSSLRRLVRERTPRARWRRRHRAALAVWSAWPRAAERPASMLVEHALGCGDAAHALRVGLPVVRRMVEQGTLQDADRLVGRLLPLAEARGAPETPELTALHARVGIRSGRAAQVRARLTACLDDPERPDRTQLLVLLGSAQEAEGNLAGAQQSLAQALRRGAGVFADAEALRLHERLGTVCMRLGDRAGARAAFEDGLARLDEAGSLPEGADLWEAFGRLDAAEGCPELARMRHEQALEMRRRAGDPAGEARSLAHLAELALRAGELSRAHALFEQALRLERQVGTLPALARTLARLARLESLRGAYGRALALVKESLDLWSRCGDAAGAADAHLAHADLLRAKGEPGRAREEIERAARLLPAEGPPGTLTRRLTTARAALAIDAGESAAAEEALDELLAGAAPRPPDAEGLAQRLLRAEARRARGDVQGARRDLEEALEVATRVHEPLAALQAELALGGLEVEAGHARDALRRLEPARARAERGGRPALQARAALELARAALCELDLDAAFGWLAEAQTLERGLGLPGLWIQIHGERGRLAWYAGMFERAAGWWRRALERILEVAGRGGDPAETAPAYAARPEHAWIVQALERALQTLEQESRATPKEK
jgi:tetratricopeptide (TPR) repeat protein